MATQVTVSAKYQVVIPEEIRRSAPIHPGQKMVVMVKHGIVTLIPVVPIEELRGIAAGMDLSGFREEEEEDSL